MSILRQKAGREERVQQRLTTKKCLSWTRRRGFEGVARGPRALRRAFSAFSATDLKTQAKKGTSMVAPHTTGKCPHCNVHVRFEDTNLAGGRQIQTRKGITFTVISAGCPECGQPILTGKYLQNSNNGLEYMTIPLWPDSGFHPVPKEIEAEAPNLAADFSEAAAVLPKSKKASAALARRCLQFILREKGGTKSKNLADQIEEVINNLPTELGKNVDAIRQIGNFAAHPIKSTNSGEIADVEEGEAEWLLSILEELFDYYYVTPIKASRRRDSLNQKLQSLGKPALKQPQC